MAYRTAQAQFTVLLFGKGTLKGAFFQRKKGMYELCRYGKVVMDYSDPATPWKNLKNLLGISADCPLYLCGNLENGIFLRLMEPDLSRKDMHSALEMELPRHIPGFAQEDLFQFAKASTVKDEDGLLPVNVYTFSPHALDQLNAIITQSCRKADAFFYPFCALSGDDDPVYIPEAEEKFFFEQGQWHKKELLPEDWYAVWEKRFNRFFRLPDDGEFSDREYFGCLLAARFLLQKESQERLKTLSILPGKLRPSRIRGQFRVTLILLMLLAAFYLWDHGGKLIRSSRELSRLEAEHAALSKKINMTKLRLKRQERELREITKVLNQEAGEEKVLEKLALFSSVLPSNVMVMHLRWNHPNIDMMLRSEAENLNMAELIRPLKIWKVTQFQQRRRNNELTSMINMKLSKLEDESK